MAVGTPPTDSEAPPTAPEAAGACSPSARFPTLARLIAYLDTLSGRADLRVLERLLREAQVSRPDVEPACCFGLRGYKRNTISRGPWYELLALCWRSGDCTPIHDHEGSSCAFRVVQGLGTEIRFRRTPSGLVCPCATNEMPPGYICAAEDADIHQVVNLQASGQDLVTLHIYSPPIRSMHTYAGIEGRCEGTDGSGGVGGADGDGAAL